MIGAALLVLAFLAGYALRLWHERQYRRGSLSQDQAVESLIPFLARQPDDPGAQS